MLILVLLFIVYIIEAFILQNYCSHIFTLRFSHKIEFLILSASYSLLFAISQLKNPILNITFTLLFNFIFIFCVYKIKAYNALLHSAIATICMTSGEMITAIIVNNLISNYISTTLSLHSMLLLSISKWVYSFLMNIIAGIFSEKEKDSLKKDASSVILSFTAILFFVILITLCIVYVKCNLAPIINYLIAASILILLLLNILNIWIYQYTKDKLSNYANLQVMYQSEHDLLEHNTLVLQHDEKQKILIHDINKHLHAIAQLNNQNENTLISSYINNLIHSSALSLPTEICNHPLLNAILCRYNKICNENHISFKADIQPDCIDFLNNNDITTIFCNILDNAIESASTESDSYIDLNISKRNETQRSIIRLVNSCNTAPSLDKSGALASRKKDSKWHGYGLKSVKKIVEKYNGDLSVNYDCSTQEFQTLIIFK